jgi:hypothetical protein
MYGLGVDHDRLLILIQPCWNDMALSGQSVTEVFGFVATVMTRKRIVMVALLCDF